jgi:DNA-directed RNA polymerase subunit M/transcription elongation factor TFIIS
MSTTFRIKGKDILLKFFSKNETNELEKCIYDITKLNKNEESEYNSIIYEIIGDKLKDNTDTKEILIRLKNNKIHWSHSIFDNIKNYLIEQDGFIVKPFEVSEGCIDCVCGSNKIFLFQKQVRSADEGMTTFATCSDCGRKWSQ